MPLLLLLLACADPLPLPTEAAVEATVDRAAQPALYRKLYDYAFLPEVQYAEQRVRLRIWLRYMDLNRYQLGLLRDLAARTRREREAVAERQRGIVAAQEPGVKEVYDDLWAALDRGASEEELAKIGQRLDVVRTREAELLELRARSVRTLFEAQTTFLQELTPTQEALLGDAIFLLRHRLDPYANPGDFNALVGPIWVAGEFGSLSRTTFDPNEDHLNIAGLWSEKPTGVAGPHFPNLRREVVLYMVCLEPALPEAIDAELAVRPASEPSGPAAPAGAPVAAPAPAGEPTPGVPVEPAPGIPVEPAPAAPGSVEPAKPGTPVPPAPGKAPEPAPLVPGTGG